MTKSQKQRWEQEGMKVILRAFLWSVGLEMLLLAPVLIANHVRLGAFDFLFGVLSYFALYCHAPAVWLLRDWPAAQESLIVPALLQWCLWFIAFGAIFSASHIFRKRGSKHEAHAA